MPTKPPVATVSPSPMRRAASSAVTIVPLSSAFTGASVSRTALTDMGASTGFQSSTSIECDNSTLGRRVDAADMHSIDAGQIEERDRDEYGGGFGHRDHEHVLIGLPVRETRHGKQGDHGTVVRQGIHAAAGHCRDAVKYLERNVRGLGGGDELIRHRGKGNAHAAGRRAGDAGKHRHGDGLVHKRIWNRPECGGNHLKAGQQRYHAAEPIFGGCIASSAPATAALLPSANFARTGRQANANTVRMPRSSAPSTAQIAAKGPTFVTMGWLPSVI